MASSILDGEYVADGGTQIEQKEMTSEESKSREMFGLLGWDLEKQANCIERN